MIFVIVCAIAPFLAGYFAARALQSPTVLQCSCSEPRCEWCGQRGTCNPRTGACLNDDVVFPDWDDYTQPTDEDLPF